MNLLVLVGRLSDNLQANPSQWPPTVGSVRCSPFSATMTSIGLTESKPSVTRLWVTVESSQPVLKSCSTPAAEKRKPLLQGSGGHS